MNTRQVQQALREIGFPIEVDGAFGQQTFTAVKDFQRGFAFWALLVDGHAGEKTHGALRHPVEEQGRCSEHSGSPSSSPMATCSTISSAR